jgi:hypothetical protein
VKILEEEGNEEILKEREKKEEIGGHRLFCGTFTRALLLLGILGSDANKPQGFLELGSRIGFS